MFVCLFLIYLLDLGGSSSEGFHSCSALPLSLLYCMVYGANMSPQRAVFHLGEAGSSHSAEFILQLALCFPVSVRALQIL